jgi:hypothetical protein
VRSVPCFTARHKQRTALDHFICADQEVCNIALLEAWPLSAPSSQQAYHEGHAPSLELPTIQLPLTPMRLMCLEDRSRSIAAAMTVTEGP